MSYLRHSICQSPSVVLLSILGVQQNKVQHNSVREKAFPIYRASERNMKCCKLMKICKSLHCVIVCFFVWRVFLSERRLFLLTEQVKGFESLCISLCLTSVSLREKVFPTYRASERLWVIVYFFMFDECFSQRESFSTNVTLVRLLSWRKIHENMT